MQAGGVREGRHSVSRRGISRRIRIAVGRKAPGVIAAWVLNLEKERNEHLKWTHWVQVQHCTDLPLQVTFPAHTKQRKTGPGLV